MGQVLAASSGTPLVPPLEVPKSTKDDVPAQQTPSNTDSSLTTTNLPSRLEYPGNVEELHKKYKDVFPTNFEGAKIVLNKGISNHFQVSHSVNMSSNTMTPSGYRFGATYVGVNQVSPTESYPVLLGDIDTSGNLNATVMHQLAERVKGKLATQIHRNKFTAVQMTADYKGDSHSLSVTLGNPNMMNGSGLAVVQYLQSITPNLALGGEIVHQREVALQVQSITVPSLVGRYVVGDSTMSGNIGANGVHLCFHQKASQQLQVGVELEINARMQDSTATIAYQVDLPKADLVFRGCVDSNWTVGAVLEKKLQPLPFSFALSGMLNHTKNQFRLGCGLIIG